MTAPDVRRTLRVNGLVNARDLGGLSRHDGGSTPYGVFYRSESVDAVTDSGWEQILAAGIRTVVDLRQPTEREQHNRGKPEWLSTVHVDLDGLENSVFWADYWENGLCGTAIYYLPHLEAMPERAVAALSAIVNAPEGGVLFHCSAGRDRTGMIALLLLTAAGATDEAITEDYLDSVRLGEVRAAHANTTNLEPELESVCAQHGTTTEAAFRGAISGLNLTDVLETGRMSAADRHAFHTWRGMLV